MVCNIPVVLPLHEHYFILDFLVLLFCSSLHENSSSEGRKRKQEGSSLEKLPVVGKRFWHDKENEPKGKAPLPVGDRYWGKETETEEPAQKRRNLEDESIATRTGGAYIPPARLKMMQAGITDKSR